MRGGAGLGPRFRGRLRDAGPASARILDSQRRCYGGRLSVSTRGNEQVKKVCTVLAGCLGAVALLAASAPGANGRSALAGSVPPWATAANFKTQPDPSDDVG